MGRRPRGLAGISLPFIAPVHVMVLGVIVIPSVFVIWLSFQASTFGQSARFVGVENYVRVLGDPYFWRSLLNTVAIIAAAVHIEMLLGLAMALLFASRPADAPPASRYCACAVCNQRGDGSRHVAVPVRS